MRQAKSAKAFLKDAAIELQLQSQISDAVDGDSTAISLPSTSSGAGVNVATVNIKAEDAQAHVCKNEAIKQTPIADNVLANNHNSQQKRLQKSSLVWKKATIDIKIIMPCQYHRTK